tara:strand:+ start:1165 stop:2523 length:1359 start_codon:yes stop_codon:yes gene_type:complete
MKRSKSKTAYLCSSCGNDFSKWFGQCPSCSEWDTLSSFKMQTKSDGLRAEHKPPKLLKDLLVTEEGKRVSTNFKEVDRVLGGGLLQGSFILLGGSPGVGKSTLALHICAGIEQICLYISAEESEQQVALRANRIGMKSDNLHLSGENDLNGIITKINHLEPQLVIIDSIQTIINFELDSLPGSPSQIRDCGQKLLEICKQNNIAILIIGHITKEGNIAGPKMLEHMVDTVLYLEGDNRYDHRILRSIKNRFGATYEVGIFSMGEKGMTEVKNPSEMFLEERSLNITGTCIYPSLEGTRPILVEVQALVSKSTLNIPQRNANGFDYKRMNIILAVLEKRMGLSMANKDVFINLVGGLKIDDPAADLSILCTIASSSLDKAISNNLVILGEVGLGGEVRSINNLYHRISESSKLGFEEAIFPKSNLNKKLEELDITLHPVKNVKDAFQIILNKN